MQGRRGNYNILDLENRWQFVYSVTPQQLYSQGRSPKYSVGMRLSRPQRYPRRYEKKKHLLPFTGIELWLFSP
jgi:hypothetical protein